MRIEDDINALFTPRDESGGYLVPPDVLRHMVTGEPYPEMTQREKLAYWLWRPRRYLSGIWDAVRDY